MLKWSERHAGSVALEATECKYREIEKNKIK